MNMSDFCKEHIVIDERTRISKKLNNLCDKYEAFIRYVRIIQKEPVGILLSTLKKGEYLNYTILSKVMKKSNYSYWINYLVVENIIVELSEEMATLYTQDMNFSFKPKVYKLTKKGKDFISIDYINEYLESEYEVEKE